VVSDGPDSESDDDEIEDEFFRRKNFPDAENLAEDTFVDDLISAIQGPATDADESNEYMNLDDGNSESSTSTCVAVPDLFPEPNQHRKWICPGQYILFLQVSSCSIITIDLADDSDRESGSESEGYL
jgi:hypothetical protein